MAKTKQQGPQLATLSDTELQQLRSMIFPKGMFVNSKPIEPSRPDLARLVLQYDRHHTRIATLRRVLDPDDKEAGFNRNHGTEDTINAELLRRIGELDGVVKQLRNALLEQRA